MVRAFALHAKCRGFESLIAHHPSLDEVELRMASPPFRERKRVKRMSADRSTRRPSRTGRNLFHQAKKVPCAFSVDADRSPEASESGMLKFRIPAEKGVKYTIFCACGPFQRRVS